MSPRKIVQIGLGILFVAVIGLMSSIGPELSSVVFGISLALFGGGIGLVISQLGNVVMSSVGPERSSEAGGVQGAAQNLGQSLGTALIGAVLLTGLTTGFTERVQANPAVPPGLAQKIADGTEQGIPMVSQPTVEKYAEDAGLPQRQVDALVADYGDAQVDALKRALLVASVFVLVGLWFARSLPGEPLGRPEPKAAPAAPKPAVEVA
jgi:hypothetical protein